MLIRHLVLHIEVLTNLIEDGFDLGIRFGNRLNEGIVARKLMNPFKEGLYVRKSYVAQYGIPKTLKAPAGHKLIGASFLPTALNRWYWILTGRIRRWIWVCRYL
ncbi:type 2 periplasmic-binding domain-containing protein [Aggregatibacter actinomycetemcomitans]|uniref:LysR family transcriptional regulator n=1 Tax=Aggregatibacter actinomycetemcomitans TaxID=714 RepID=UPI001F426E92|nr:LysR family transcriptional regulator [Aggregatibacter actinomycetemcomitans]